MPTHKYSATQRRLFPFLHLLLAWSCASPVVALADEVVFSITGHVNSKNDPANFLGPAFAPGGTFTGTIRYDPTAAEADQFPDDPNFAVYFFTPDLVMEISSGGHTLSSSGVADNIVVAKDQGLAYDGGLPNYDGMPILGASQYNFFFQILGAAAGAVPTQSVPTHAPRFDDFASHELIIHASGAGVTFSIVAEVTAIDGEDSSPRHAVAEVQAGLVQVQPGVTNRTDRSRLGDALKALDDALMAKNWVDDAHLQAGAPGESVFNAGKLAVTRLGELIRSNRSGLTAAQLQEHVDNLVAMARELAVLSIEEAVARQGKRDKIKNALKELGRGDDSSKRNKFSDAIERYKSVWKTASRA